MRLLEKVELLMVTGKLLLDRDEYDLVKEADKLIDIDIPINSKTEFMSYIKIINKIGTNWCASDIVTKIEGLHKLRGTFFIGDRYGFIQMVDREFEQSNCDMKQFLNKLKICSLGYNDSSIFIDAHRYMMIDVEKNGYRYKKFLHFGEYKKIPGIVGLMVLETNGNFTYYRDDVIKSGKDKVEIINKIGMDNIDLVITVRNLGDRI